MDDDQRLIDLDEIRVKKHDGFRGTVVPVVTRFKNAEPQVQNNYRTPWFRADRNYRLAECRYRYGTANGAAATIEVRRYSEASGNEGAAFSLNLDLAANTWHVAAPGADAKDRTLLATDWLEADLTAGGFNTIANLTVVIYLEAV